MSSISGPNSVRDRILGIYDAAERNSVLPNSLINMNNWTVSTGSVTGYGVNGGSAENQRILDTNPWGDTDIVWGTYPSGDGNGDGGWNGDAFNIDNTKIYRFSVWVRRTSSTASGNYYLGLYGNGTGIVQMSDNVVNNNSYWYCNGIGELPQNTWYLLVGHAYPWNTTYTGRHPDTGYYLANNPNQVTLGYVGCNIGSGDVKWSSNTTSAQHRVYHYYCADNTSRLQFYDPRVDLVDGKQPTINELVTRPPSRFSDASGNGKRMVFSTKPVYDTNNLGGLIFNGTTVSALSNIPITALSAFSNFSFETWVKITSYPAALAPNGYGVTYQAGFLLGASYYAGAGFLWAGSSAGNSFTLYSFIRGNDAYRNTSGYNFSLNTYYHCVMSYDYYNNIFYLYINGSSYSSASAATQEYNSSNIAGAGNIGIAKSDIDGGGTANYRPFGGYVYSAKIYNKALSAAEVLQNYNATKGRFGL